jgi:hypothetical protein
MRTRLPGIALLASALVAGAAAGQGVWAEFRSKEGRFVCSMPGKPEYQKSTSPTKIGPIDTHLFTAQAANKAYVAGYSDFPAALISQSDPKKLLDGGRDGAVARVGGKLVGERQMKIGSYAGREIVVEAQRPRPLVLKQRMYLVGNRLYQVVAVTPKEEARSADVDRFLDSLKVSPPPR